MRPLRACAIVLPLLGVAACAMPPAAPSVSLLNDAFVGAGDETRSAIFSTAAAFSSPSVLANQPAEAARAVAAEAVRNGLRELGAGAGPVDVFGLRERVAR